MMNYFGISKKKEKGCPLGLINMALYDAFYSEREVKKISYGNFPWYANASTRQPHEKFPSDMCLIVKERNIDFDIRGDSNFFHIVSAEFVAILKEISADYVDMQAITVCNAKGDSISEKNYFVIKLKKFPVSEFLNMSSSEFFPSRVDGVGIKIKKFVVNAHFNHHVFQVDDMSPGHNAVFCSEDFKDSIEERLLKGIKFISVDGRASGAFGEI